MKRFSRIFYKNKILRRCARAWRKDVKGSIVTEIQVRWQSIAVEQLQLIKREFDNIRRIKVNEIEELDKLIKEEEGLHKTIFTQYGYLLTQKMLEEESQSQLGEAPGRSASASGGGSMARL